MDEEKRNIVNIEKENFSERYELYYESTVDKDLEKSIVDFKNEVFDGLYSSTGRKFTDILATTEELVKQNRYIFTQDNETEYYSEDGIKNREKTLTKGNIFEPNVTLSDIVSKGQREDRGEGLTKPTPKMLITGDIVKSLVTSGLNPIDILCLGAEFTQMRDKNYWKKQKDLNKKDLGEIRRGMAKKWQQR
mgnify:CR=1 FL=1